MVSKTSKQSRFMQMSASTAGRKRLKARGVKPAPVKTAKEFVESDKKK